MNYDHDLKAKVRTIPDYPKPGILFRDITTLLIDARAFHRAVDQLVDPWAGSKIDKVAGIEARGIHPWWRGRTSGLRRLRADPKEGQATVYHGANRRFAEIWP